MWNRLVAPPIDDKELMDRGGEVTSAKEGNDEREWLSVEAMTVDGGVAVGLWLYFMACERTGRNSGCQYAYIHY